MDRIIVLAIVGCYLPGYKAGGPVRSVANLVERLGDEFDFRIITSDRDLGDTEAYRDVAIDAWSPVGKAQVFYASPRRRSWWSLIRLIRDTPHDVVYLNSFFDPVFTLGVVLSRRLGLIPRCPMVIAPRGEFSEGALGLKAWKKRPYIALARVLSLYRDMTWQASSKHEVEDIRRVFGGSPRVLRAQNIAVAPDLACATCAYSPPSMEPGSDRRLRIVFLSRIARKKNLDFALRVLARVTEPVEMSIYGTIEDDAYWRECQSLAEAMEPHLVVRYGGAVSHESVVKTLSEHDLFYFPTRGENYGHVIHEALSAGLPVLISDQTPWRDLNALGIGWDLPLEDPQAFADVINRQARMSGPERTKQRVQAREYATLVASDAEAIAGNRTLFRDCTSVRDTEDC